MGDVSVCALAGDDEANERTSATSKQADSEVRATGTS